MRCEHHAFCQRKHLLVLIPGGLGEEGQKKNKRKKRKKEKKNKESIRGLTHK